MARKTDDTCYKSQDGPTVSAKRQFLDPLRRGIYSEVLRASSPRASQMFTGSLGVESGPVFETPDLPVGSLRSVPFIPTRTELVFGKVSKVADVKPKVLEAYSHEAASAPRKVTVERKLRHYSSLEIETLLSEKGYECGDASYASKHWLPVELFDDTAFDDRSPQDWISLGYDASDTFLPLAAQDGGPDARWFECQVMGYDREVEKFAVRVDNCQSLVFVPRLHLLFKGEDPVKFANRVAAAHQSRTYAESVIQYNYYIDNMPIADTKSPGTAAPRQSGRTVLHLDKAKRIANEARPVVHKRGDEATSTFVEALLAEIHLLFARTMNKITFDHRMNKKEDDLPFKSLREVIGALTGICAECNTILQWRIYCTAVTKALKLEEFRQLQRSHISQVAVDLQDTWAHNIYKLITEHLASVGKGWFNLHETNKETYDYGKLKKLLTVARLLMQDSLRYMTMESLQTFTSTIETYTSQSSNFDSPSHLKELCPNESGFQFNVDPELFLKAVLDVFEKGLLQMGDIPQPEKLVLPHLFKNHPKHVLASVGIEESWVQDYRKRLTRAIDSHFPRLQHLLSLFEEYLHILEMKPEDVAEQTARRGTGPSGTVYLKQAVNDYLEQAKMLEISIPDCVLLGAFRVSCAETKKHLAHKLRLVANLILDVLAKRFREQSTQALDQFRGVFATLKRRPRNIEEVTELQAYLADSPANLERFTSNIKAATHAFETLEHFSYKLYLEDHTLRWKLYGSPLETISLMDEIENVIQKDRQIFLEDMLYQQAEFGESLKEMENLVAAVSELDDMGQLEEINSTVQTVTERLNASLKLALLYNNRELLFGTTVTDYSEVQRLVKELEPIAHFWSTAFIWSSNKTQWLQGPFDKIDAQLMERQVYGGIQIMQKVAHALQDRHLESIRGHTAVLAQELQEFSPLVPLVLALRHEGMRTRHWDKTVRVLPRVGQISTAVGKKIWPGVESFTLNRLLELQITQVAGVIVETGDVAAREFMVEKALKKMKVEWERITFSLQEKYKSTETYILTGTDDIVALLDEHVALTQTLQFCPDKKPFEEEIEDWYRKLLLASETLDEWLRCQRSWMYLQPVFDSPDIVKQLGSETKRFRLVDTGWRALMRHTLECPLVLALCSTTGLLEKLRDYNNSLEKAQHGLESYLDVKRSQFARFYFLSNEELLGLLSETKDPRKVQPFVCKVFENVEQLEFEDATTATALVSSTGERLLFARQVQAQGKHVEAWMTDLEHVMRQSVRAALLHAITSYPHADRPQWALQHPAQCVLCGDQIHWTVNVEAAIRTGTLAGYSDKLNEQLLQLVAHMRSRLDKTHSVTVGALIVTDVHAQDVVERLRDKRIQSVTAFEWISQLRYYWRDEGCCVQCVQTDFPYGYEYLDNSSRLVLTPLTDLAYMTLMGAQLLNLGGALTGPAGTGKTETIKDLAKAVARQCVVFNCSNTMDFLMLGKFFKGLASAGAWCCFDEFNRINVEVLSVVAQHLTILFGSKAQATSFTDNIEMDFEGTQITVMPVFNVFVTMNPGYPGRSELPDNLKSLFRPMAMMMPDYTMIGEIMLYSFGFDHARLLSRKMIATFKLASEQLTTCDHYDYGMRAVRSVINAAGMLRRTHSQMEEQQLLLRALKDINVPKFVADDLTLFDNITGDLFPGVKSALADHKLLTDVVYQAALELGLQPTRIFLDKVMQLYDTMQVRHAMMLIGPTGGGKTSCYQTLAAAIRGLHGKSHFSMVHLHKLNPKALTIGHLYGQFNELTHEWTEGVVAILLREAFYDESDTSHWIVFDGPVDALWIESMNSVLDDNRKLCLNSGEIIPLTPRVTVMFEAEDLSVASPATVSRCGMVYMEPQMLGKNVLVTSWLNKLPCTFEQHHRKTLDDLFPLLQEAVTFVRGQAKEEVTLSNEMLKTLEAKLIPAFVFGLTWSVGCVADAAGRFRFSDWLLRRLAEKNAHVSLPSTPESVGLFDLCYDVQGPGTWMRWEEIDGGLNKYSIPPGALYERIVVPTEDSQRIMYILKLLLSESKQVICSGPHGTGKTANIAAFLCRPPDNVEPTFFAFSARTHVNQTQELLEARLEKRRRGILGPHAGKRFVVFIDDFNLPRKEEFGAQPPLELLRQWLDHGGWYSWKTSTFVETVDTNVVAAMTANGDGQAGIPDRLIRHFNVLILGMLQDQSICTIFSALLRHFLGRFSGEVQESVGPVMQCFVHVYSAVVQNLLPTPSRLHYTFNMRDLWKTIQGMATLSCRRSLTVHELIACWVHESLRVFGDRLVSEQERDWLRNLLYAQTGQHFGLAEKEICPAPSLIFADFCGSRRERLYESVIFSALNPRKVSKEYISLQRRAGAFRVAALRLTSRSYGVQEWREGLKTCLLQCGLEGKKKALLLEDAQLGPGQMLEDISFVLSYADIPQLYKKEELEEILTTCKDLCKPHAVRPTRANIFNEYLRRIQAHAHLILVLSPMTEQFRTHLRMYPSLTTQCTVNWFSEWPAEALTSVAQAQLDQARLATPNGRAMVDILQFVHLSAKNGACKLLKELGRQIFVTPTTFFDLLSSLINIQKSKQLELATTIHRLHLGLEKLEEAARQVEAMQKQLHEWQPALLSTSQEIELKMAQIQHDRALADETKICAGREESEASEKAAKTQELRDEAQRDLDEALPALDQAVECLKRLKAEHVREIKALTKPPAGVVLTMEAVCIMFQVPPVKKLDPTRPGSRVEDFWESAQHRLLKDPKKLLDDLLNYDKENIPEAVVSKIASYIDRQDFDPAAIRKASVACEAICTWVRAMLKYYFVTKAVEPKRVKLRQAEEDLFITTQNLNATKAKLQGVENKIARLAEEFVTATKKKEQLSVAINECLVKVDRAKPLLAGLANEKHRWGEQANLSKEVQAYLPGHALLSAAMIAYGGPFPASYRAELHIAWLSQLKSSAIPHAPDCTLRQFLGCPLKIRQWNLAGLPKDDFSVENGIILDNSRRWPLMIDPQMQATRFIKALGRTTEHGFEVCKVTDENFLREMELAIQFGKWMLVEGVTDTLGSFMEPILLHPVVKKSPSSSNNVCLGKKLVPWSPNFKLFLTTANPTQILSPETYVKLTVLNFSITPEGLEDQLLALIVSKEAPELEDKKNTFVTNSARMRKELKGLEDKILQLLSQSQGDFLEDEALMGTLAAAKFTAEELNKKVEEAEVTEQEIDKARECYRIVAARASILYFCVADLANLQFMYQYSLQWFLGLITAGIDELSNFPQVASSRDSSSTLEVLKEHLTYLIYENVSRALFEKHQLIFSFLLGLKIQALYSNESEELRFLLTGSVGKTSRQSGNSPSPVHWLSDEQWRDIQALSQLQTFTALDQSIRRQPKEFEKYFGAAEPHRQLLPSGWNHLAPIQRMCILRILRSDKIAEAARDFVTAELGHQYTEHPNFNLARFFKGATKSTPLVFILSPGYDPFKDLCAFAKDIGMERKLEFVALGKKDSASESPEERRSSVRWFHKRSAQRAERSEAGQPNGACALISATRRAGQGQGQKAKKLVEDACCRGGWILLQNCHVAASWMPELERICARFTQEEVHRDFRLWLSSLPTRHFPTPVLQNGVKIITEPPTGLRSNLLRLFASEDESALDGVKKPEVFRKISFAFCFFHAIVQERKKFGSIGWNVEYDFTVDDLIVCQRQLKDLLGIYEEIPYQALVFLGAKIHYGGRVTDDLDRRLLERILKSYVNADVIEQGSKFKFSSSGVYYCPDMDRHSDFVQYIRNLPLNAGPEAFGLHENANIKVAQAEGMDLLNGILVTAHHQSAGDGTVREQAVDETLCHIAGGLPENFEVEAVRAQYPICYHQSLNTVLLQEVVRFNGLLRVMRKSMSDLRMAIKGQTLMTEELEGIASSIFDNVVPKIWSDKGFLSMKLLSSWIRDLHDRIAYIRRWVFEGLPACFWLPALFCPQAYLTGVLQNHARRFSIAIDRLSLAYALLDGVDESTVSRLPPSSGCYVWGIYLEGSHWDIETRSLKPSRPKILHENLPMLWVQPVADRDTPGEGVYSCPVYKVPERKGSLLTTGYSTNHVLSIEIPIDVPDDVYIKAGVAGFLSLRD